jgi:hypothetical protein
MQDLQFYLSKIHPVSVFQPSLRDEGTGRRQTETPTLLRQRLEQKLVLAVWPLDGNVQSFSQFRHRTRMIDVAMGNQNLFDLGIGFLRRRQYLLKVATGIHDGRLAGGFAAKERAVLR